MVFVMNQNAKQDYDLLLLRYPALNACAQEIELAFQLLLKTTQNDGTIFTCGNGGSAADSEHIIAELGKSFKRKRRIPDDLKANLCAMGENGASLADSLEGGIRAISLTGQTALSSAYANDRSPETVFAQQLSVLGRTGDALIAISTSGNSENCVRAAMVARALGIGVIALTGEKESRLSALADCCIRVPETEVFRIQELHLPVYHALCAMLESELFSE